MTPAARERMRVRTPLLVLSASAWILLLAGTGGGAASMHHVAAVLPAGQAVPLDALAAHLRPGSLIWSVVLMLAAMMLPLLTAPVGHVRAQNFLHRRERAIALFLAGYASIWVVAAALLVALSLAIQAVTVTASLLGPLVVTIVLVWQFSPVKQRCLNRTHVHPPLAAFGAAGFAAAFRFGVTHAGWCVGSCWALMLVPWLIPAGHVAAMAAVTLWISAERLDRPTRPRWRIRLPTTAAGLVAAHARIPTRVRRQTAKALQRSTTPTLAPGTEDCEGPQPALRRVHGPG